MTISRPHVCEIALASAQPDDYGNVLVAAASMPFTPDEAREFAAELTTAAAAADAYRLEQQDGAPE